MFRAAPPRCSIFFATLVLTAWARSANAAGALPDFTALVDENGSAVVNISTTQRKPMGRMQVPEGLEIPDLPEDSPFHDFFRRFFGEPEGDLFDAQSLGSGFIISPDGYVISNYHVIRNADEIIVRLSDRREFTAEVVGADERSDISLLRIEATDLPVARLGIGHDLRVGEWVLAIGSPFGFEHSVTAGIVSAVGRNLPSESYVPFIQTDVAINPGNSGGPLFNLHGEVVGVNSQIFSRTGGFMGLSFAIPIEAAMDVANQLRERGRVSRGWLGVLIHDVSRELAESFDMDSPRGALIVKVLPEGPAASAGFEAGDIVVEFDGHPIFLSSDLPPVVGRTRVGARVPVEILRAGTVRTLWVLTTELPREEEIRLATTRSFEPAAIEALGLDVADISETQREEWALAEHGVLVTEVEEGAARHAGLRQGDVILVFNGAKVHDADEFRRLTSDLPIGDSFSILVQRQGEAITLTLLIE